jgi:hypothetical protein
MRPGVRKMPEPMTEPMKRRRRSRGRRVRERDMGGVIVVERCRVEEESGVAHR